MKNVFFCIEIITFLRIINYKYRMHKKNHIFIFIGPSFSIIFNGSNIVYSTVYKMRETLLFVSFCIAIRKI